MMVNIVLFIILNALYKNEIIDPRNKAYGVNYDNKDQRPPYTKTSLQQLCTAEKIAADKTNMIAVLDNWKKKQAVLQLVKKLTCFCSMQIL